MDYEQFFAERIAALQYMKAVTGASRSWSGVPAVFQTLSTTALVGV